MPALASDLRRQLENVITDAREKAEAAARAALKRLAVDAPKPFDHFSNEQRELRNRLRARARQAGDRRKPNGEQEIDQLTQELAYEYWHRMLFARFLAENHLLMHPDGVAVSLAECDELAKHEGAENGFVLAAQYASRMLPQIFRTDDVLLEVDFPINDRLPLEKLLASLPTDTFIADDSLGWVYQFWQAKKKEEVNKSGEKIDGHTLPAVTQLFTEPYMVKFLLHNTIGAWWCARHGIKGPPGGAGIPNGQAPVEMEYLRWRDDGTPAAGTFDGWPESLKDFTMLDPCCGSGHFLVEAFNLLVPMRMRNEGLLAQEACDAVLAENLFGLELDPRCTQIAAFALALAAWKYPDESGEALGYRELPKLNIACSGQSVTGRKEEWLALANSDEKLKNGMEKLYDLFRQAPHLGSLIDPRREAGDLFAAGFSELQPLLEKALAKEKVQQDADAAAVGVAAQGITKAADLMSRTYTLAATNVPYLGRGKQSDVLQSFTSEQYGVSKADLATVFYERCHEFASRKGSVATVIPQTVLFLNSFKDLRTKHLARYSWNAVARLGPGAFEMISGENVNVALLVTTCSTPNKTHEMGYIDVSAGQNVVQKDSNLRSLTIRTINQKTQLESPESRITGHDAATKKRISYFAKPTEGLSTGDESRYIQKFWEQPQKLSGWEVLHTAPQETLPYKGLTDLVLWEDGSGDLSRARGARVQGHYAWGKAGVLIARVGTFRFSIYRGNLFDKNTVALTPNDPSLLPALWAYCSSPEFETEVRRLDKKPYVTTNVFGQIPFDEEHWKAVAQQIFTNGLPDPHSNEPTEWLFKGNVATSTDSLQVAVARMLGYHWPEQPKEADKIDALADNDGIVCIPAVRGERPTAERLLEILQAAYGTGKMPVPPQEHLQAGKGGTGFQPVQGEDSTAKMAVPPIEKLLTDAGCKPGTSLDDWLRNEFFEQHCKRFHNRPFIWHIWDGRKDGFSCLVNYHNLNHKRLEMLTYSYLQDWITAQAAAAKDGKPGADLRLVAAQELQNKLKLILTGEPPYDIFVRWKPIEEQPIGWNPDLNDGVRVNIRPFMTADVLRKKPSINWSKDRGKEPGRNQDQYPWFWKDGKFTGDRINDYHLTNAQKRVVQAA